MLQWKQVWRNGISPALTTKELVILQKGLISDDPKLIQGKTINIFVEHESEAPVRVIGACALAYCGWIGSNLETMTDVLQTFNDTCTRIAIHLKTTIGFIPFVKWFDNTPREQMRQELLEEVNIELERRGSSEKDTRENGSKVCYAGKL